MQITGHRCLRSTGCFYDETMGLYQQQQTQLKSWLIGALEQQELMVFYQPQYDVANQDIIGFEAVLRWDHPEVGWISPDKFIPVGEANGMIIPVTEWILRQVCAQIKIWQDMGYHNRVSVNISAVHLRRMVGLAASLGLEVLAEGVETDEQLDFLRSCGCDSIQGWLMNPAMSSFACTQLLAETDSTQRVMKSLLL